MKSIWYTLIKPKFWGMDLLKMSRIMLPNLDFSSICPSHNIANNIWVWLLMSKMEDDVKGKPIAFECV